MTAGRYRSRPEQVDAIRYDGTNRDEVEEFLGGSDRVSVEITHLPGPGRGLHAGIKIRSLKDEKTASVGDWIIRHPHGEHSVAEAPDFDATYEPAE